MDPKNMYRLQLGKTETEFFSERGNHRLKRIWLENNLDEEMIFAQWIGPSKTLVRQRVSDYMQAYLMRRSTFTNFQDPDITLKLRRFSMYVDSNHPQRPELQLYDSHLKTKYKKRQELRESEERLRVGRSVAAGDLPTLPGYECVVKHPVFIANEIEKRMKQLVKLPLPYSEEQFEKHILPIMTALAIAKERTTLRKNADKTRAVDRGLSCESKSNPSSSGFLDDSNVTPDSSPNTDDSDLIQVLSEMDLNSKEPSHKIDLDQTLNEVCEICGGFLNNSDTDDGLSCTCIPTQVWNGKRHSTAAALYDEAEKIIDVYLKEQSVCSQYMEQFSFKTWLK